MIIYWPVQFEIGGGGDTVIENVTQVTTEAVVEATTDQEAVLEVWE